MYSPCDSYRVNSAERFVDLRVQIRKESSIFTGGIIITRELRQVFFIKNNPGDVAATVQRVACEFEDGNISV